MPLTKQRATLVLWRLSHALYTQNLQTGDGRGFIEPTNPPPNWLHLAPYGASPRTLTFYKWEEIKLNLHRKVYPTNA